MTTTEPITLPPRQQEAFDFIRANSHMYGPAIREIAAAMGIRSPNGVVCHLNALEKKGLITIRRNVARGIEVVQ
jgi:repressor LexA